MKGRKQQIHLELLQLVDSLLILAAIWVARLLRELLASYGYLEKGLLGTSLTDIFWLLFIVVPFGPIVLERYGFYDHPLHKRRWESVKQMFQSLLVIGVAVGTVAIFGKLDPSSRLALAGSVPIAGFLLLARESITKYYLRRKLKEGARIETVVFAGSIADIEAMRAKLPQHILAEWRIAEVFDLTNRPVNELSEIIHEHSVARVVFAAAHTSFDRVQEAVRACEVEGVEAWIFANFLQTSIARPTFDFLGQHPMLVFRTTPEISWALLAKTVFDRVSAFIALMILAIPMLLIVIAIKKASPGSVIFRQRRCGQHGKPFTMFKFRTMHPNADKLLDEVKRQSGNEMSGPVFKLHNDPRIFPLGKILRKYSLDELPQLMNVVLGDMSIVGPRPLPTYEVDEFTDLAHRRRLSVKPGLTCLWQVSGRNAITDFDDWVKLDLEYIDNWSLSLDLSILLRTIPVVLFGKGAK